MSLQRQSGAHPPLLVAVAGVGGGEALQHIVEEVELPMARGISAAAHGGQSCAAGQAGAQRAGRMPEGGDEAHAVRYSGTQLHASQGIDGEVLEECLERGDSSACSSVCSEGGRSGPPASQPPFNPERP